MFVHSVARMVFLQDVRVCLRARVRACARARRVRGFCLYPRCIKKKGIDRNQHPDCAAHESTTCVY